MSRRLLAGARWREVSLLVILVVAIVGLITYLTVGKHSDPSAAAAAKPPPAAGAQVPPLGPLGDIARRVAGDPLALGSPTAPVVMVMFSDFRCPFCAQFSRDTEGKLVSDQVQRGLLRIEWRDYPIFGQESYSAAHAGRAAAAQGKFWEFTRAVYQAAPERGHPEISDEQLLTFARQAGVPDLIRFRSDMGSAAVAKAVQQDADNAAALGVPSTPAFVINGTPVLGAQPLADFTTAIDSAAGLAAPR